MLGGGAVLYRHLGEPHGDDGGVDEFGAKQRRYEIPVLLAAWSISNKIVQPAFIAAAGALAAVAGARAAIAVLAGILVSGVALLPWAAPRSTPRWPSAMRASSRDSGR